MKKTITENERLQAFALYTMATQHYAKVREFERGIARIFGDSNEYNDAVSGGIYFNDPQSADPFDEVLARAGITVDAKSNKSQP